MVNHFKTALFFIFICIFSAHEAHAAWWWLTSPAQHNQQLPDISTALINEFDRLCDTSSHTAHISAKIALLKDERIPAILQELEYQNAEKPFKNNAEVLTYAFALVRSACLDFYAEQVDLLCAKSLKNPPFNPAHMDLDEMRQQCVQFLYERALKTLCATKRATLKEAFAAMQEDVEFAVHLAFKASLYANS